MDETANDLVEQVLRGLPGEVLRMFAEHPVPWLAVVGLLVLIAWLGRLRRQ